MYIYIYIRNFSTVHIYYSKHGASDVKHFEIPYSYGYGIGMTEQKKQNPPVPPPKKAR